MNNVESHRTAHEAFNRRDFAAATRNFRDDAHYTDHSRSVTYKGPAEFEDWMRGWTQAFSDATVAEPRYVDGGEFSVAVFQGRGTNDGPLGPMAPTGRRMDLPFCEVFRYDADGRVVSGEMFYDTMTIMVQLGHLEPMPAT